MLLDTSGLLNLFNASEAKHTDSIEYFESASERVTHNYILAEFVALAHSRRMPRLASLNFIQDIRLSSEIKVVWIDVDVHDRAMNFLLNRLDKGWSMCDAVSMILMNELELTEALTTDHHFEQAGFIALLRDSQN